MKTNLIESSRLGFLVLFICLFHFVNAQDKDSQQTELKSNLEWLKSKINERTFSVDNNFCQTFFEYDLSNNSMKFTRNWGGNKFFAEVKIDQLSTEIIPYSKAPFNSIQILSIPNEKNIKITSSAGIESSESWVVFFDPSIVTMEKLKKGFQQTIKKGGGYNCPVSD